MQKLKFFFKAFKIIAMNTGICEKSCISDFEDIDAYEIGVISLKSAKIRWFHLANEFGFADTARSGEYRPGQIDILRTSGLAELIVADAVAFRVLGGKCR